MGRALAVKHCAICTIVGMLPLFQGINLVPMLEATGLPAEMQRGVDVYLTQAYFNAYLKILK